MWESSKITFGFAMYIDIPRLVSCEFLLIYNRICYGILKQYVNCNRWYKQLQQPINHHLSIIYPFVDKLTPLFVLDTNIIIDGEINKNLPSMTNSRLSFALP